MWDRRYRLSILPVILLLSASSVFAQSEITLLSPGSIQASMENLVASFESKTGHKVKATFASGGVTRQQVMRGEVFDVIVLHPSPISPPRNRSNGHCLRPKA